MDPEIAGRYLYELRGVSRLYDAGTRVAALRDCNLAISRGEFIGITGTSGSGKSTLLNLLGLMDLPTAGSMWLEGIDTTALSERQRTDLRRDVIGFVFQAFHLLPYRTAADNVRLPMIYQGIPAAEARRTAADLLDRMSLAKRAESLPTTLSGGEAQRVAIARALAGSPQVLLCDEPTGNLDSQNTAQVVSLLERLNAEGLTIVLVTHDRDVARHAHRIIEISDGAIVRDTS